MSPIFSELGGRLSGVDPVDKSLVEAVYKGEGDRKTAFQFLRRERNQLLMADVSSATGISSTPLDLIGLGGVLFGRPTLFKEVLTAIVGLDQKLEAFGQFLNPAYRPPDLPGMNVMQAILEKIVDQVGQLQPYQVGQLCALGLLASLMMIQSAKIEKLRVKNELATTRETLEMAAEMKVYDRKKLPRLKLKQQK